jgi:kumamolisin
VKPIAGSRRDPMPNAKAIAGAAPDERLEVTVLLRRGNADDLDARIRGLASGDPGDGCLSREAFAERYSAREADIAAVERFAAAHGLSVVGKHPARRTVILSGTVAQLQAAFGVELHQFAHPNGTYRGRTGEVHVPDELSGVVKAVLGLDNRPQAKPHFRQASSAAVSYTPVQLAALYGFPPGDGEGECIALIELGGGYKPADLTSYFAAIGVAAPSVVAVSVDHATNAPSGDPSSADGEVMLDIEVAGAIAPKAKIAVYFAPNTDAGFLDAVTTAAHDATNKPSIISISWGGPESSWTSQSMTALDQAIQAAATMGVTVCVASGDNGSSDGESDNADHVDFPASSSFALACGGTSLQASSSAISKETVWNDGSSGGASGGGVSSFFALPDWQKGLSATKSGGAAAPLAKRGVPDVCGDADPETGYQVRVDGENTVYGGTSAVAPLWAGLIARINQAKGSPVGFINPALYKSMAALRDITSGNNGDFTASTGWDACTGLGSPNGSAVAKALGG